MSEFFDGITVLRGSKGFIYNFFLFGDRVPLSQLGLETSSQLDNLKLKASIASHQFIPCIFVVRSY